MADQHSKNSIHYQILGNITMLFTPWTLDAALRHHSALRAASQLSMF